MQYVKVKFVNQFAAVSSGYDNSGKLYSYRAPNEAKIGEKWVADSGPGLAVVEIIETNVVTSMATKWIFQRVREDWLEEAKNVGNRLAELQKKANELIDEYNSRACLSEYAKRIPALKPILAEINRLKERA